MPINLDKETILKELLEVIEKESLTTIAEVETFSPVCRQTLYEDGWTDVYDAVKQAILTQRVKVKHKYKQVWKKENAPPVLQLAGFKLIADSDELERLTVNNNNNKQSGELTVQWVENRSFNGAMIEEATVIPIAQIEQPNEEPAQTSRVGEGFHVFDTQSVNEHTE